MNNDYTHLTMVLDRSGSMESVRDDVIGGLNQLIKEQRELPGKCTVLFVQFDTEAPYEVLRDFRSIQEVELIGNEYRPRGGTPLYDCLGRAIVETGDKLKAMPESERPGKVVLVIITDGMENSSREYSRHQVMEMIKRQTDVYKWQVVYLGANQDAMAVGQSLGTTSANSANYAWSKTADAIYAVSANLCSYRGGSTASMSWSDSEREDLM